MPAYTYRSTGTVSYSDINAALTPGAPAGKATGDLLILVTGARGADTLASLAPDWTLLASQVSAAPVIEIWGRIADGSASDSPSPDWSGTSASLAVISAYYGDVYTDLATIVVHSGTQQGTSTSTLQVPAVAITTNDTLVITFVIRQKTATSDDATTITEKEGFSKRVQHIQAGANDLMMAYADIQQTTATSVAGTDYTRDGTNETNASRGVVLSLRTAVSLDPIRLVWRK